VNYPFKPTDQDIQSIRKIVVHECVKSFNDEQNIEYIDVLSLETAKIMLGRHNQSH